MSEYYDHTTYPAAGAKGTSAAMRAELELIDTGLAKLPTLAGNGAKAVVVNALATALAVTVGTLALAGNFATTGAYNTTLVQQASTSITLPTTNSVMARTDAAQTFTGVQTFSSQPIFSSLTASQAVFTDGSKGLVSNAVTGTGNVVMSNNAVLVAPALGTPASGVATNLTGTAAGLTAGNVTTNANLTGPITSTGNATAVAAQTGTGSTFAMQASPTLTTPNIGVATATSINGNTITTGTGTLTLGAGSTLATSATNSITLTSTGATNVTLPTSGTLATTAQLIGGSWASPGAALGTGTPVAGTFNAITGTTLTLSGSTATLKGSANAWGTAFFSALESNSIGQGALFIQTNAQGGVGLVSNSYIDSAAAWKAVNGAGAEVAWKAEINTANDNYLVSRAGSLTAGGTITWTDLLSLSNGGALTVGSLSTGSGAISGGKVTGTANLNGDYAGDFVNNHATGRGLAVLTQGASTEINFIFRSNNGNTTVMQGLNNGAVTIPGTTVNMTTSGTTLTVGVGADNGTVSAGVFTDRTKAFDGDAVGAVKLIKAKNGHIDHATLPAFARENVRKTTHDAEGKEVTTVEVERNIGAMVSVLTVAVQELDARIAKMEKP